MENPIYPINDQITSIKSLKNKFLAQMQARNNNKSTISQYTPKKGEQVKFNKQKLQRIAEENAPLNRMAASQGAENIQDAIEAAMIMEGGLAAGKLLGKGAKAVGKYATENTALKNTYNILPEGTFKGYSKLKNPNKSYRVAGMDAARDFESTGVLRSNNTAPSVPITANFSLPPRPTSFPSFQKGYADMNYAPKEGAVVFETGLPTYKRGDINPVTGDIIRGRHYAHRVINPETGKALAQIPSKDIKMYGDKPNWFKGYKEVKKNKINSMKKNEK